MRSMLHLAVLVGGLVASPAGAETYQWTQYAEAGLEARAVTDGATCPLLRIDGQPLPMRHRAEPGAAYPVLACVAPLPAGTKGASLGGAPLALPAAAPRRIVVIGDTGCRMKGRRMQACNDPDAWPFQMVAASAAVTRPDLIIHVGDFHYRETPCPAGDSGCAGSPTGDTWPVWRADFFKPAASLLSVAPWIAIRGNHETCDRGGQGWSRTLDPHPFDQVAGCNPKGAPIKVALPGLTLAVLDVADADEDQVNPAQLALYRPDYESLAGIAGPVWLLQHRPTWSGGDRKGKADVGANPTLAAASLGVIPKQVEMMLSGHHHMFKALNYDHALPPQLVSGHGGDDLEDGTRLDPAGTTVLGVRVTGGRNLPGHFGFTVLDRGDDGAWTITDHDVHGTTLITCRLAARAITCPAT